MMWNTVPSEIPHTIPDHRSHSGYGLRDSMTLVGLLGRVEGIKTPAARSVQPSKYIAPVLTMFNISSLTTEVGNLSIVVGGLPGQEAISPHRLGPQGSEYELILPSQGYIKFRDAGDSVSGPGDWSVQFHGSSTNWFYSGEGQAVIVVKKDGQFTVSGGKNTITGTVQKF